LTYLLSFANGRHLTIPEATIALYLVAEGTLDECIRHFMARPEKTRHLYDIQITPQLPLVTEILTSEYIIELARLRDFL